MHGKAYLIRKVLSFSKAGSIAAALMFSVATALTATSVLAAAAPAVDPLANPPVPAMASSVREEVIATGLNLPRSLVALPDGNLIVSEGSGTVHVLRTDGTLFITTMAFNMTSALAQNINSLNGKVLLINSDGSIPADNPYAGRTLVRQEIFSMGHRDPDGGFIHPDTGELWTIEHGPMGGDELNVIRKGKNYGWPIITYGKEYDGSELGYPSQYGMEQPLYYWFPSVAPSGLLMYTGTLFPDWQGDIFLGTMSPTQGKHLVRLEMDAEKVVEEEHLLVDNDRRVRALAQGADGALYVLTDSEANNQTNRHFAGEVLKLTPQ